MTVVLVVLIIATVTLDIFGEPPAYLTGLLGTAAGVWFAAIGSDRGKREAEVAIKADRAEARAEALEKAVVEEHPEVVKRLRPTDQGDTPPKDEAAT